jgi:hypothetical protein
MKSAAGLLLVAMILLLAFGTLSFAQGQRYEGRHAWSFGVVGDTQWTLGRPGYSPAVYGTAGTPGYTFSANENPNFISESIFKQMRQAMIARGVKFVFQMGDSSNNGGVAAIVSNATDVQDLYNSGHGIGFFPLRGNHATYAFMYGDFFDANGNLVSDPALTAATYPPNMSFVGFDTNLNMNNPEFLFNFPQTQGQGLNLYGARHFSSPTKLIPFDYTNAYANPTFQDNSDLKGLSYSFDYGPHSSDARFVIMDFEATGYEWHDVPDKNGNPVSTPFAISYTPGQQQEWISERLDKNGRGTEHAFVFSHRQPMGQNHHEALFGAFDPNPFFQSLQRNDVKYYITAHDHLYNRSIVKSPDMQSEVTQIITSGASTKFYLPSVPIAQMNDQLTRETELAQEINNVGYYIYTVDGPRVTVDYYSDSTGNLLSDYCWPRTAKPSCSTRPKVVTEFPTPTFDFVKKESFGYSLNGEEFLVAQGESYTSVEDRYRGTKAKILAGTNGSTLTDHFVYVDASNKSVNAPRPLVKAVNTGWTEKPEGKGHDGLDSDILSLWGMADMGTEQTDVYVLSMSHDFRRNIHCGKDGIVALDDDGDWVNAVDLNVGTSTKKFVNGPYKPTYGLGTYGIDPKTKSAWAVLDYNADFALGDFSEKEPCHRHHGHCHR